MDPIEIQRVQSISSSDFIDILKRSGLAERRPVEDPDCIEGMVKGANLFLIAKQKGRIIGVARSMTDFHYACYLSDLAVDENFQRKGVGRMLLDATQAELGHRCKLILLSAPGAVDYYPRVGFEKHPSAWVR